jgi:ferritin-like metal-binding protein YciE
MPGNTLRGLYLDELRDLYSAENQLIKALPKMAESSTSPELRSGFEEHLKQTKNQAQRLEQIFDELGENPKRKKCRGMVGLIEEGEEMADSFGEDVRDAGLISAAQRVEHYEIAAYGTAREYARILGEDQAATLLQATLDEEKETDKKLTELAKNINLQAPEEEESEGGSARRVA